MTLRVLKIYAVCRTLWELFFRKRLKDSFDIMNLRTSSEQYQKRKSDCLIPFVAFILPQNQDYHEEESQCRIHGIHDDTVCICLSYGTLP